MILNKKNGSQVQWLDGNASGELIRTETTVITDEFMDELELLRKIQAAKGRIGDMMHVARVPRAIHERWLREGFDPSTANEDDFDALMKRLREIVARLKSDGMDKFILTDKTF